MSGLRIAGREVGGGAPCFVIAEVGVNHNGELALAQRLVEVAAQAGADAVKFQTFDPATLAAGDAPKAAYQARAGVEGSQRAMLERLTLSREAHGVLKAQAEALGLVFLSSPFEERSADFLHELGVPAFKIPSGEVTNHPFLRHVARKARPVLMSTGMCTLDEVAAAVAVIEAEGAPLALFHCVSSYPADPARSNLRCMDTLRARFGVPVGWSDHTPGTLVSALAVARGAALVEKHLTLDHGLPGPDHRASLEPDELTRLVQEIRLAEAALGDGEKRPSAAELEIARVARKSLHWRAALPAGAEVTEASLIALRPGTGIAPSRLGELLGRRTRAAVDAGALVDEAQLEPRR